MDKRLVDKSLLSEAEINWFNQYHELVFAKISPMMQGDDLAWLTEVTQAI
jgi:Xaa-Pro aminopeptidase